MISQVGNNFVNTFDGIGIAFIKATVLPHHPLIGRAVHIVSSAVERW